MSPDEAIVQACLLRFRPIMMTTLAALFGALPLAIESGTGAELRFPLGISIIGGLLLSQLLTLYTTPVIYLALDRLNRKIEKAVPDPAPPGRRSPAPPRGCSRWHRSPSPSSAGRSAPRCWRSGCFWSASSPIVFLPVVGGAECRFPDRSGCRRARPGADPAVMAATVAAPLERRLGADRRHRPDHLDQFARHHQHPVAVRDRPQHRPRGARRAGRDQRLAGRSAERPAVAAALPQGQSRRRRRCSCWR